MKTPPMALFTSLMVTLLFASTGGVLLWSLVDMALSLGIGAVEYFGILPHAWEDENHGTLAATAALLVLPIVAWFGWQLFRKALRVEREIAGVRSA